MNEDDSNTFSQWQTNLLSTNMVLVLNTMQEIVKDGAWSALGLLSVAGDNVTGIARHLPIKTRQHGTMKFDEYRRYCIEQLQQRLVKPDAVPSQDQQPRVFISYNHQDRESANALALELTRGKASVFLDYWEMAPQEEILPRIERELHAADVVIPLLSPNSSASRWVQRELEIVVDRQEAQGVVLLLPVLLADCNIPEAIAARPYHDLRDDRNRPMVAQAILNQIFGIKPFSQRVLDFLSMKAPHSPYTQQAQLNGRRLLQELGKHQEMELSSNQMWFLWEAFHRLVTKYRCTLKMGADSPQDDSPSLYSFAIFDRWNQTSNTIVLTPDEFDRGMWKGMVNLMESHTLRTDRLEYVGSLGRFTIRAEYNPNVETNTAEVTSLDSITNVLHWFLDRCSEFDEGTRQSFLYDFQGLVLPNDWHTVSIVVGSDLGSGTHAHSAAAPPSHQEHKRGVFEVHDPFFSSLKYTSAQKGQLTHLWEGDVDLMSPTITTDLGLA